MMYKVLKHIVICTLICGCILIQNRVYSQNYLEVKGRLVLKEGDVQEGKINLFENGELVETYSTDRSGKFKVDLEVNKEYIFEFAEEGYVAKKISINTNVSDKFTNKKFTPIYFAVELFNQYQGVNTFVFTQPVGIIKFYNDIGDFDYDVDYSAEIRSKVDKAERELEKAHQVHLQEERSKVTTDKKQVLLAQKASEAAERQRKIDEEKAAAEARRKVAEEAKVKELQKQETLRKQQEEAALKRRQENEARKQAELEEKQRSAEQQRLEAGEKAKQRAEEEARKKAALEAKIKADQAALKKVREEAEQAKLAKQGLLLAKQQEEAEKRKQEEDAKALADHIEKQQIQEQQRIEAERKAKEEAEETLRKRAAEEALMKAQSEAVKKAIEEKEKREKQELTEKLEKIKKESETRKKEEEQIKIQKELEEKQRAQQELDIRRAQAVANKIKKQNQTYRIAQDAAEEFVKVKKDYPKGKTVEEFEKFGMKITRVILIENESVTIFLKVVHDWGETFFFKNNQCISKNLYDLEVELI